MNSPVSDRQPPPYSSPTLRPYGLVEQPEPVRDKKSSYGRIAAILVFGTFAAVILWLISIPKISDARHKLELKQLGDVAQHLHAIKDVPPELAEARGREFYEGAINHGLLPPEILSKLVSLNGPGSPASKPEPGETVKLLPHNCSYTGPQGNAITQLLQQKGPYRRVVMTFNAANWHNYPDHGVAVLWSDGEAQWLTQEEAQDEWGITEEEWRDPAGQLFGKKAPFEFTHE